MPSRVEREREVYDHGALRRDAYNRVLHHAQYLWEIEKIELVTKVIGSAKAKRILELGSNNWFKWFEQNGVFLGDLHCINISEAELEKGRSRSALAAFNHPTFHLMDAHELAFPDDHFDVVYGGSILHHLDLERALKEVNRTLKNGGRIVFVEPLDINPVAKLVRLLTPFARTADEVPFTRKQLGLLSAVFDVEFHMQQLLSVPVGVLSGLVADKPDNWMTRSAYRLDRLLVRLPWMGYLSRRVIIIGSSMK